MKPALTWATPISYEVFPTLAGISIRDFHLAPSACVKAFKIGSARIKELFGGKLYVPAAFCPPLSYGHIASLGIEIDFPEGGAPVPRRQGANIEECLDWFKKKRAIAECQLFKDHLCMWEYLQKEFPEQEIKFSGFGKEGPITTAVLLRGQDFFIDLYECPEKVKEFLKKLTASLIEFEYFRRKFSNLPTRSLSSGLADDFAALVPPALWEEFVLPFWEEYYVKTTREHRSLHCEGLAPEHLSFLNKLKINRFDPDWSPKLTNRIIAENIDCPFAASLQSFAYPRLSHRKIEAWIRQAVADGAGHLYSYIYVNMCQDDIPAKVVTFINTLTNLTGPEALNRA